MSAQFQGEATDVLQVQIPWEAGRWYCLALNYGAKGTQLLLDGELIAEGPSLPAFNPAGAGWVVGSDWEADNLAGGLFDELATFAKALPTEDFAWYYQATIGQAALGPISPEEAAALAERRAKSSAERDRGGGGPEMRIVVGGTSECVSNVPVYLTNIVSTFDTNQGWAAMFDVQGGTNGAWWDIFTTTNLIGNHVTNSQWCWLERGPSCSTYQYTNQAEEKACYIVGTTNDTDHGGLADAFELLVTHTDLNIPDDDLTVPFLSIYIADSVAVEQQSTNTARFVITRLGGFIGLPLTVGCQVSGTASNGVDYYLSPATTTATNVLVTFPPLATSVEITLAALSNSVAEGTEYATLTLTTNVQACEVNPAHSSATAWILEQYTHVYTLDADFNLGVLAGLEAVSNQLQFKTNLPAQFPFINMACLDRGTVARINTTNGQVIGEYRTVPEGLTFTGNNGEGSQPSRTTVDLFGNVWVANRDDTRAISGTDYGSITRIGLIIGGNRYDKIGTNYVPNPYGHYVSLSNATYNTCRDRDGDGFICSSGGLADILPWDNGGGVDSDGGVSTADDEAITDYTRVPCTGTRTVAVDKFNDIWVGGHEGARTHLKVNGLLALPVPNSVFNAGLGGYGGVIDGLGHLWSSGDGNDSAAVLWLWPPTNFPPQQGTDWWERNASGIPGYGIAVDPLHDYIWQTDTTSSNVFRWHLDGTPDTNANGVIRFPQGFFPGQGLTVASNGHVWVAHGRGGSQSVGHLDTSGVWLGNVSLVVTGLWAEYFANTNLAGWPVRTNVESPVDFSWTNGWPASPVPTNAFSARWSGTVAPQAGGDHVFYVSAEAGAAFRLRVNSQTIIDNWANPATNAVELAGTNWLGTNIAYDLRLEYAHWTNAARVRLSWKEPGLTDKEVIPAERLAVAHGGATGVSVDAAGRIWAACYDSNSAVRIDPNAGPLVSVGGVTNHVGWVDMVVYLGDGSWHPEPYNVAAKPYNYSDMTGFNNRIVNPSLQPLKGYWTVIDDSGTAGEWWHRASWTNYLPAGCTMEVYARAADGRQALAREVFVPVSKDATLQGVKGRYIELRVALTRDDPSKQPVLYELTLFGQSTAWAEGGYVDYVWPVHEGDDVEFYPVFNAPGPFTYQWYALYPWASDFVPLAGETNATLVSTNVDSFDAGSSFSVVVTIATGESVFLEPAELFVGAVGLDIPGSGSSGPASRYPATIDVFGQPTNFNRVSVTVTLWDLGHQRSADLSILLVSPLGTNVMLMSNVGGTNGVSDASLRFTQGWSPPPQSDPLPSGITSAYGPSNYGGDTQIPQVGTDPPPAHTGLYSTNLDDMQYDNPIGQWKLYIYDRNQGMVGELTGSWQLNFEFE